MADCTPIEVSITEALSRKVDSLRSCNLLLVYCCFGSVEKAVGTHIVPSSKMNCGVGGAMECNIFLGIRGRAYNEAIS